MSYRFASTQVNPGAYHWGFRGLGVPGSEIAHGGDYDGYVFPSLSLPADASKEYWAPIVSIPVGMTNLGEDSSFDYAGTSAAFQFDLYENGTLLGRRTASILIDGLPVPEGAVYNTVECELRTRAGVLRSNLTGLSWALFSQSSPNLFGAPTAQGAGLTTSGSGVMEISVLAADVPSGTYFLVLTNSAATITFAGLVVVS